MFFLFFQFLKNIRNLRFRLSNPRFEFVFLMKTCKATFINTATFSICAFANLQFLARVRWLLTRQPATHIYPKPTNFHNFCWIIFYTYLTYIEEQLPPTALSSPVALALYVRDSAFKPACDCLIAQASQNLEFGTILKGKIFSLILSLIFNFGSTSGTYLIVAI